jgi:hypothetical protein
MSSNAEQLITGLSTPPPPAAPPAVIGNMPAQPAREARCLLGWMEGAQAVQILVQPPNSIPLTDATEAVAGAASAVNNRLVTSIDQSNAMAPPPPTLDNYVTQLRSQPGLGSTLLAQGWSPALIDLRQLYAFQPIVYTDGLDRVANLDPHDLESLARVTIPISEATPFAATFDERARCWVVSSPNPNLRVVGAVAPGEGGAFGFGVGITPSMVQVIRSHGRLLLHDGYHRCVGLLRHGIHEIPALVWDNPVADQLVPAGMLPSAAYLGDRPPGLADYFDDMVSCTVRIFRTTKVVTITATEFNVAS